MADMMAPLGFRKHPAMDSFHHFQQPGELAMKNS